MKFENTKIYNFQGALRGMRNPKNSWHLSDSNFGYAGYDDPTDDFIIGSQSEVADRWAHADGFNENEDFNAYEFDVDKRYDWLTNNGLINQDKLSEIYEYAFIGPNDMKLAQTLCKAGTEHSKFLRQIFVSVDITAPQVFWSEFDTYKVGTVANSTSKMHKLTSQPITADCFEIDNYRPDLQLIDPQKLDVRVDSFINDLEQLRQCYLRYMEMAKAETNEEKKLELRTLAKQYWYELIRWLPESWLQTRTVTFSYANLRAMVHQRQNHKLTWWSGKDNPELDNFIKWVKTLPYAEELIFYGQ